MAILAISTSQSNASIAIKNENIIKQIEFERTNTPVCESIIETIKKLLKQLKLKPENLTQILVDTGPGSFTGLRIGIATANALSIGLNISVISYSSLDLIAQNYFTKFPKHNGLLKIGINAGRSQVYTANFKLIKNKLKKALKDHIESIETFSTQNDNFKYAVYGFENHIFNFAENIIPTAKSCFELFKNNSKINHNFSKPNYVRLSDAELNLKKII